MLTRGFFLKLLFLAALAALFFFAYPTKVAPREHIPMAAPSLVKLAFNFLAGRAHTLKGEDRGRINMLLLGMTGIPHPAPFLTDTIILASIKPGTGELALLSLPRDLLVRLPDQKIYTKINALYNFRSRTSETSEKNPALIRNKIEEITGQPIDYVAALDIGAAEYIVDAMGGLNVLVPEDVVDPRFPSDNDGTEEFSVQKGWRWFDGKTAQRYLRTRHSAGGDFARMRQQQAVLEALRKKAFGMHVLYDFPAMLSVYQALSSRIQTDMNEQDMKRLYDIAKTIRYDTVTHRVADGDPSNPDALLKNKTVMLGGIPAFALVPKIGDFDYYSIGEIAEKIFAE